MFNFRKKAKPIVFDPFFVQNVKVEKIDDRLDLFRKYCTGKSVLHFGCTDYPIFNPNKNLHIHLNTYVDELYGFDIDEPGIEELKKYVDKPYFTSTKEVGDKHFDVCLIPETIEHVDNIRSFLEDIATLNCSKFIITGPNCFSPHHMERNTWKGDVFEEIVHPDHNCWFSAYTLNNVVKKYTSLKPVETYLLAMETMVCVVCEK
ncbi:MAG: class I SAM-dependent methyltransferase [Bacteroidota bacterium]|nr:class I SAM-dependent methyltransferase [Bacteroidota bacterium]